MVGDGDPSDDAVVGHVMLSRSWVDAREALVDVLVLSPLPVAPGCIAVADLEERFGE